jgi:phospholipid/cholesterol/gamma-HCH transport system substrate-binding protein
VLENLRPLATEFDNRKAEVNEAIEPLAENYLRLNALGSYGAYFNYYICATNLKFTGPAGSDIILPMGGVPDQSKGRCSDNG